MTIAIIGLSTTPPTLNALSSAATRLIMKTAPARGTTKAIGIMPFSASSAPITAHSATPSVAATICSIWPVDRRWPATLMMSSVRPMMWRNPSVSKYPASPVSYQPGKAAKFLA